MNFLDLLRMIVSPGNFEPHRLHFVDMPQLMWFIVLGNALVALAYFLIPVALVYFIRRRKDLVFHWVFIFFAAFIFFCALTHIMHIVTFWYPAYWLQGVIDGITGIVSIATALSLIPVIPQALKLPSPEQLRRVNTSLQDEINKKEKAEKEVRRLNKNLEKIVQERTAKLEEAYQRLQDTERRKDEFISMASHELKTPITSMNGYLYALQKSSSETDDPQTVRFITKIQEQIKKQMKLIADLLDVTRLQVSKLQIEQKPFNLNDLVKEIAEDMQATAARHTIVIEGALKKEVNGDRDRVGQVLTNLIGNAIKFSPHADKVIVSVAEKKNEVTVAVQDFGMGIDAKHLDRIFERFYRVDDSLVKTFPGLGVGLYITSQIVKQHGGKVWVESKKGKGSTFYFSLPVGSN
jgi:signal transduction histidine kinase